MLTFVYILSIAFFVLIQEQLKSAEREIAMGNERERQLHLKIKKLKDDVKAEKEEVTYLTKGM